MEPSKKNNPGPIVIAAFAVIALLIVFYFVISTYFPDLFQSMNVGDAQPVK